MIKQYCTKQVHSMSVEHAQESVLLESQRMKNVHWVFIYVPLFVLVPLISLLINFYGLVVC